MAEEPGVSVAVTTTDKGALSGLQKLAKQVQALDPALDEIGAMLVTSTQHRIENETDPEGKKWASYAPLSKRTLKKRGDNAKMLRDRADLYDSLTHSVMTKAGVRVGSNRKYARIHQLGGQAGPGRKVEIKARPYLGISPEDQKEIDAIVKDHLDIGGAG